MRVYSRADEERIRLQARVRSWTRGGLLDASQGAAVEADLRTELKRTNRLLRAVLALFAGIIISASVGLAFATLNIRGDLAVAITTGLAALGCVALANHLAATVRVYRYGVEEALAAAAVVLLSISTFELLAATPIDEWHGRTAISAVFAVASAGAFWVYRRFGFVYAGIAAMACAAAIPFPLSLTHGIDRLVAACTLAVASAVARARHRQHGDDFPGDEYAAFEAAALAGMYLVLNLHLFGEVASPQGGADRLFYWFTYAAVWVLPAAVLALGIAGKDRLIIDVGLASALATLVTNKAYLEWPRNSWDPMLLGTLLVGAAIVLRRWLSRGPNAARAGFTADRLDADPELLGALGNLSAAMPMHRPAPAPDTSSSAFGGGRSGGGGASGSY